MLAPLTVVLESDGDFRRSEGLALIDDVSRLLTHQRQLTEVRSATQPLGSPQPLDRARLASRLGEVNAGFHQLARGAEQLHKGLNEGAAKLRAAIWLEEKTGLRLTGSPSVRAAQVRPGRGASPVARDAGLGPEAGVGGPAVEPGNCRLLEPARAQQCVRGHRSRTPPSAIATATHPPKVQPGAAGPEPDTAQGREAAGDRCSAS